MRSLDGCVEPLSGGFDNKPDGLVLLGPAKSGDRKAAEKIAKPSREVRVPLVKILFFDNLEPMRFRMRGVFPRAKHPGPIP